MTNGHDLYAFRYAVNDKANSLYYRDPGDDVVIVSEPLDNDRSIWKPVPPDHVVIAQGRRAHRAGAAVRRKVARRRNSQAPSPG